MTLTEQDMLSGLHCVLPDYRLPIMDEFSLFTSKLQTCDLIVLTEADETRTYCRFYANGLYQDRMFISDVSVKENLTLLSSEEDVIDWNGVQNLRKKYCEALHSSEGIKPESSREPV
ncbi:hypothetical protein I0P70_05535 [Pontibacter sp. FD36]|uniref:hypothetical protein n=1 Tax=Pontibacter sp. FD36 TaxID=2789860 RepID=UPI0018AA0624|nr:hypothetical protein [Pontibacter sp. FD36]MBF8962702.1 hypothetical protein [Pontibacter sp. FD36]